MFWETCDFSNENISSLQSWEMKTHSLHYLVSKVLTVCYKEKDECVEGRWRFKHVRRHGKVYFPGPVL
jgi:hypothetical protein